MTQPTFRTSRLLIRPRTLADTDACLRMDRDPEVTRYVSGPWSDPIAHRSFVENRTRGPYAPGLGYWAIASDDAAAIFAGWVLLIPLDARGPEIEIGWRLRREMWGRGIAAEAARPVLQHAFRALKLTKVVADIDPDNAKSRRVAEKLGLKPTKVFTSHQGKPAVRYSLTFEDAACRTATS